MSTIPVRRTTRTTRSTKDNENANARPSRIMTRAKVLTNNTGAGISEVPANRLAATTAASRAKAVENSEKTTGGKRKRDILAEVTEVNKDKVKSKTTVVGKGKEKAVSMSEEETVGVKASSKVVSKTTATTRKPFGHVGGTTTVTQKTVRVSSKSSSSSRAVSGKNRESFVEEDSNKTAGQSTSAETSSRDAARPDSRIPSRLRRITEDDTDDFRATKRRHTEEPESDTGARDVELDLDLNIVPESADDEERIAAELELVNERDDVQDWDDLDAEDMDDPLMVSEYILEIVSYMKKLEQKCLPTADYMDNHVELDWEKRETLLDWILQLHSRYNFYPETFFLCVNIMDRFLSLRTAISLTRIQLMGISCFSIAAKFEEGVSPSLVELVKLTGDAYTAEQICAAERFVLKTICYDLSFPGPMSWLRRGSKADDLDPGARTIGKYLLEAGCFERELVATPPSLMAAASLWLARLVLEREEWTPNLVHYTGYKEHEIIPTANVLLNHVLRDVIAGQNESVYKKYASKRVMKCSVFIRKWALSRFQRNSQVDLMEMLPVIKDEIREERAERAYHEQRQAARRKAEEEEDGFEYDNAEGDV